MTIIVHNCPFCDHDDVEIGEVSIGEYAVECNECRCIGPIEGDIMAAIASWNKAQNSGQDINHQPAGNCLTTEAMPHLAIPPLVDGETYVGAIGDASGKIHHVILLPGDNAADPWKDQMAWAKSIGGDLPNRIEQAMLFASFKDQFKQVAYWSNQQHASVSGYAWFQGFGYGTQRDTRKDGELRARAVRRLVIE